MKTIIGVVSEVKTFFPGDPDKEVSRIKVGARQVWFRGEKVNDPIIFRPGETVQIECTAEVSEQTGKPFYEGVEIFSAIAEQLEEDEYNPEDDFYNAYHAMMLEMGLKRVSTKDKWDNEISWYEKDSSSRSPSSQDAQPTNSE